MGEAFAGIGRRIVLATHRRSGTHLVLDLLRRQFPACRARKWPGEATDALYLNLDRVGARHRPLSASAARARLRRAPRPLVKTHALSRLWAAAAAGDPFLSGLLAEADLYCVVRDGRDVLCSLHDYVRSYDPRCPGSLSAFLRQRCDGLTRVAAWAADVRRTLALPGVRRLSYEEVLRDPAAVLARLAAELGAEPLGREPLLPPRLSGRGRARWRRLARDPDSTAIPGAGRTRDWRSAFTRADRELFAREAGELLVELGYEPSDAWVDGMAA